MSSDRKTHTVLLLTVEKVKHTSAELVLRTVSQTFEGFGFLVSAVLSPQSGLQPHLEKKATAD